MSIPLTGPLGLEVNLLSDVCTSVDSPRSLAVSLLAKYGEWEQLARLEFQHDLYVGDPMHFAKDYLVSSMLRKSQNLPLEIDRRKEALSRFYDGEDKCREVNDRYTTNPSLEPEWLSRTRDLVRAIMGPLKREDVREAQARKSGYPLDRILELARHGPGACAGLKGTGTVGSDKYDAIPTCTRRLLPYAQAIMGPNWWDANSNRGVQVVEGSEWTAVPKSALTDRGIAIEPLLNVYLQLGIGEYLAKRLIRFGCDLRDQSWNQWLAKMALPWKLSTLDLSNASDTMAWSTVLSLVPEEWLELLSLARSDYSQVDGHWVELEKFSSMGNGFTFPLESLIFLAVVYTFVPREDQYCVGVYGDDIICPQANAADVIQALNYLGFSVNTSKSFQGGEFFESCGHDYFRMKLVTPFYARGEPDDPVPYALHLANELRKWSSRYSLLFGLDGCSSLLRGAWETLVREVPEPWNRCFGPPLYGDSVIICGELEGAWMYHSDRSVTKRYAERTDDGWEGFAVRHCTLSMGKVDKGTPGVLLAQLAQGPSPTPDVHYGSRSGLEYLYLSDPAFTRGTEVRRKIFKGVKTRLGWAHAWPSQDWVNNH